MAHIELHDTLADHPKLFRFARALRIEAVVATGHLTTLWMWAIRYRPGGDLTGLSAEEIAAAARWGGNAVRFLNVAIESRFLDHDDEGARLHDWEEYTRGYKRAVADRERIARRRSADGPQTVREQSTDSRATVCDGSETRLRTGPQTVCVTRSDPIRTDPNRAEVTLSPSPLVEADRDATGAPTGASPPPAAASESHPPGECPASPDDSVPAWEDFAAAWQASVLRSRSGGRPGLGDPAAAATEKRRRLLGARRRDPAWRAQWRQALDFAASRAFCCGLGGKGWRMDIAHFLRPDVVVELVGGKYADGPPAKSAQQAASEAAFAGYAEDNRKLREAGL